MSADLTERRSEFVYEGARLQAIAVAASNRGIAQADRQQGAMPSEVQRRADADELWTAFRRHVGIAWTGHRVRDFIAGWDAARRSVGADGELTLRGQSGVP